MKQKLITLCLLLLTVMSTNAQDESTELYPLSDAIMLQNFLAQSQTDKYVAGLKNYGDLSDLKDNGFIKLDDAMIALVGEKGEIMDSQSGAGAILGGPAIEAIGIVIADRFREELTISFLNNFREKLRKEQYLGEIFPNAKRILLYDDPFKHKAWLTSFRGALKKDLDAIPENIPSLLEKLAEDSRLDQKQQKTIKIFLAAYEPGLTLAQNPEKSYAASTTLLANVIKLLQDATVVENVSNEVVAGLSFSNMILKEFGDDTGSDWVSSQKLNELASFEVSRLMLGLTIEKNKEKLSKLKIGSNDNLYGWLRDQSKSASDFVTKSVTFVKKTSKNIEAVLKEVNSLQQVKAQKGKLTFADFEAVIKKSLETIVYLTDNDLTKEIAGKGNDKVKNIIEKTKKSAEFAMDINTSIANKEYFMIATTTLEFVEEVIPQDVLDSSKVLQEFLKYSNLAINVVSAEDPKELVDALEASILPAQSYRLKRNSYFSISINSYAGGYFGTEFLTNTDAANQQSYVTGFTAPVGIGVNWGIGRSKNPTKYSTSPTKTVFTKGTDGADTVKYKNYFRGHSISVFVSIIDVGAITSFRLANDETPIEGIEWKNVFAPGARIVWGIGKTPLALSAGVQYGPTLRQITAASGVATPVVKSAALRADLSLTVDIPFYHLYTKTEKTKDNRERIEKKQQKMLQGQEVQKK